MPTWSALADELDNWDGLGLVASFWWRDDDAGAATPELARLLALRRALAVPLCIAAVPARLDGAAIERLAGEADVAVVQHGWDHANHARPGEKKIELGGARGAAEIEGDLVRGLGVGASRLGRRWHAVLVPPWNRIAGAIVARLPALGYRGLSRFGPRGRSAPLAEVNTHVDIVAWHDGRRFVGENEALKAAVAHLRARRTGAADRCEPTGLLTHHAVHDAACWRFVADFVGAVRGRAGTVFVGLSDALEAGPP